MPLSFPAAGWTTCRLFVDNNDVGVLIENIQRDILRHDIDGLRLRLRSAKAACRLPSSEPPFTSPLTSARLLPSVMRLDSERENGLLAQISVEPHAGQGGLDNQLNVFGFTMTFLRLVVEMVKKKAAT